MFKRTSRVIAIVLTLCMVLTMNSAVFATTAAPSTAGTYDYVALGASQTLGYGAETDTAYPDQLKTQLENTGKTVNLTNQAMSNMRAEEVRMLLDDTYKGDSYTAKYFAGGLDKQRAATKAAVKNAELITVEVGMNNFGQFALQQIVSGGTLFDTDLTGIADAEKLSTFNTAKGLIAPMISDTLGYSDDDNVELLIDTFAYAYVGYKTSFDAIIKNIRQLNPNAQIVVLGIPNMMEGMTATMPGSDSEMDLGKLFGMVVDLGNLYAASESPYNTEYYFAAVGDTTTFLDEIAAYNGNPASLTASMKNCFDNLDANLNVTAKVNAKAKASAKSKALNNAYDVVATIMQAGAKNSTVDMKVLMENDFDAASKKLYKYIDDSINAAITAANNGKAYDFKFDNAMLKDTAVATALVMGVRFSVGSGFFAMPDAAGHQAMADSIMEAIEDGTTGAEVAGAEMSAAMDDIMEFVLNASTAMFDSQKQIVNKLKKTVNNLDSYAKAQVDSYASVKTAYSGKGMDAEVKAVEKELNEMRKAVKDVKGAIGTLATAVNGGKAANIESAAATVTTKMTAVDNAAAELEAYVKAASKKARELKVDNKAMKAVASEMSSHVALAYATYSTMKSDSRELAYAPAKDTSYYVALGDATTTAKIASNAYGRKLVKDLGLDYKKNYSNQGKEGMRVDDLLYILDETYEPDAYAKATFGGKIDSTRADLIEDIEKADLITVGFSNNTLLDIAISQMMTAFGGKATYEIDWTRLLDEESAAEIETMMKEIEGTLVEATAGMSISGFDMANVGKAGRAAIESYLYGYLGYYMNFQTAMDKIHEINPDAQIVLVGQYNAFDGTTLVMGEDKLPMGEYMGMLTDLMNLQQRGYATMTGKATYVEAEEVKVTNSAYAGEMDITGFVSQLMIKGVDTLAPSTDGHTYIKDQILAAMNIVDAQTKAVIEQLTGLYDLLNVNTSQLSKAETQIKDARSAYEALTAAQKAKVDADLVQMLEFCEADFDYVKVAAVGNSNVTNLKAKLATKTKLTVSWTGVSGAENYIVKIYRNGALVKTVNTTAKSVSMTNIYRGCTYKATVQPAAGIDGVTYTGVAKSASVTSKLDKANITAKKSGTNVKVSSKDQNSTGFQVWVSTSKSFNKNVTKKTFKTNYNALNGKAVALKKGTNYVKVRAYTTVNGKTVYGAWSLVKTVKR